MKPALTPERLAVLRAHIATEDAKEAHVQKYPEWWADPVALDWEYYQAYDLVARWRAEAYDNYLATAPADPHDELGRSFRLSDVMRAVHRESLALASQQPGEGQEKKQ